MRYDNVIMYRGFDLVLLDWLLLWSDGLSGFFFKQKTAYEMRISDWSSDVCSSDLRWRDAAGVEHARQGECVVTQTGIEGSLVYALSAELRDAIARDGSALLHFDIAPGREQARLRDALAKPRAGRSLAEHIRRQDRKSTRLNPVTNAHLVCRLLLEK